MRCAGRTTLAGEGLQHQDGHSQLISTTVPNCVAYDPAYAYELAVIIHDGMRRMYVEQENIFYYITRDERELRAAGHAEGRRGRASSAAATCCRSAAAARCARRCSAPARSCASVWRRRRSSRTTTASRPTSSRSPASASCAARRSSASAGTCCTRARRRACRTCSSCCKEREGPVVAATDYMRTVPDQIRQWVSARYVTLGTEASAARIRAPRCAGISKWIATTSRSPRSRRSPTTARSISATVRPAIKALGVDPAKPVPWKV